MKRITLQAVIRAALSLAMAFPSSSASAEDRIEGRVEAGGSPIAHSTVTLWEAGPGSPRKRAEALTADDGSFRVMFGAEDPGGVLYLIARGGLATAGPGTAPNPATVLMATLGTEPPERVTINELTTVASVWTAVQFLDGATLSGKALGLRIAAGNVPNLVDLETGGLGPVIQDPLNSSQTPALAKFNTLGILLSACVTGLPGACDQLFSAATSPDGEVPVDTLSAAQNIARYPWHQADEVFGLLDEFYPVPEGEGESWRDVHRIPYLNYAPSAWTLSLVFAGGGLNSLGGIAVDGEGNLWADDNFLVGAQSTIFASFGGGLSKLAPDGKPLSPMTTGFRGGGIDGPGFGIAISADDKVWVTSDRSAGPDLGHQQWLQYRDPLPGEQSGQCRGDRGWVRPPGHRDRQPG
jgi:hypothetical protein